MRCPKCKKDYPLINCQSMMDQHQTRPMCKIREKYGPVAWPDSRWTPYVVGAGIPYYELAGVLAVPRWVYDAMRSYDEGKFEIPKADYLRAVCGVGAK